MQTEAAQTPSLTRSTYDCARYSTADEAFENVPLRRNDRELYQVQKFGLSPYWYGIEVHRVGCAGFELYGYVKAEEV